VARASVDLERHQEDGDAGAVHVNLVDPPGLGAVELAVVVHAVAEDDAVPVQVTQQSQLVQVDAAGRVPDLEVRVLAVDVKGPVEEVVVGRVPVAVEYVVVPAAISKVLVCRGKILEFFLFLRK
jgi:hypothetical protein